MTRRVRTTAGLAVLAFAVACSDSTQSTLPSAGSPATVSFKKDQGDDTPHPSGVEGHSHELKDSPASKNAGKGGGGGTGISFHGGPVLQAGTKVVAVYWSASAIYTGGPTPGTHGAPTADNSLVGYFLKNLGGSRYFNTNTTYTDAQGRKIVNSVNYTAYWANNTGAPSGTQNVTDANMLSMLQSGFASGAIVYDPGTLYVIFTAGKVNLGGGFGTQYCAYHWNGKVSVGGQTKTVLYAALPQDNAFPAACTNGTAAPNGDAAADAEVNTVALVIEETTTVMLGTAWYDSKGNENADKCAWNFGATHIATNGGVWNITVGVKNFLVQQDWINTGSGGCVQGL